MRVVRGSHFWQLGSFIDIRWFIRLDTEITGGEILVAFWPKHGLRSDLRVPNLKNFPGGACPPVASFPGSRAGEEEREPGHRYKTRVLYLWPGTHCSRMRQVPLVTCILLRCTKITVNSSYLLKGHTA